MSTGNCPVCGVAVYARIGYLNTRKNLTCGPECRKKQRTIRQKERRLKKFLQTFHDKHGKGALKRYLNRHSELKPIAIEMGLIKAARKLKPIRPK